MKALTKSSPRAGMTLIEVVLAIAVAGFVLTAATSFVVSVSSIWSTRAERHYFEDHVDGVMQFLQTSFDGAGIAIATESTESDPDEARATPEGENEDLPQGDAGGDGIQIDGGEIKVGKDSDNRSKAQNKSVSLVQGSEDPIGWQRLPGASNYEEPLLAFELNTLPPLLNTPEELPALGGTRAYLHFGREHGLRLLWHPLLQEEVEDTDDLRSTQLSALVKSIEYIYWDERFEQWENEEAPLKGDGQDQYRLPRYLKINFVYEEVEASRMLAIPVPSRSVFIF
jgi:prepilin-type N-terminal cleavage/methylation domain-containing protein